MKKVIPLLLLCCYVSFVHAQTLDYSKFGLVFYDEFSYDDPNSSYPSHAFKQASGAPVSRDGPTMGHNIRDFWSLSNGDWGPGNEYYIENNIYLKDKGIIVLETSPVATPYQLADGRWIHYNAGYLRLDANYANKIMTYGYGMIEARIRFPDPITNPLYETVPISFWLWGHNGTEIDVFDVSYNSWYATKVLNWNGPTHEELNVANPHFSSGFHTFSAVWTPSQVMYYIDGVYLNQIGYERIRNTPYFYHLEFAIMPSLANPSDPNSKDDYPWQHMEIDWVKIWKPVCSDDDMTITNASGITEFYRRHPLSGRAFNKNNVLINVPTPFSLPVQEVPTIIEANQTVITGNFLADQSVITTAPYTDADGNPATRITNSYLEIKPRECIDFISYGEVGDGDDGEGPASKMGYTTGNGSISNSSILYAATKIYPNPTTKELHVALAGNIPENTKVEVHLVNLYGQKIAVLYQGAAMYLMSATLQLPDLAAGMYMVNIIKDNQVVHHEKLVIQ